ncbi:aromatic ring-hydroxylating dioxygenase subunit alpha [Halioxenophilus sp. WMMB6]|uniref:aromatic ring-hydroxylating dioxygenase subunit alpha n=1 Tax=Halioxenophilus sp. WMMB6 TaxID=3073815 RepID=UPI00295ED395|nr:aromatic ring-hydroxylating dioxygenase subunit alpha [Halioxenophilus sp. WMMB6]
MTEVIAKENPNYFLRNAWYVVALSSEVDTQALFSRTVMNEPIVLLRGASGQISALQDRCPHRFAPLSLGKRKGDNIECIYHALEFNAVGECIHNPHGNQRVPGACAVKRYATVEQDGFIWLWMGEPEQAQLALVPNNSLYTEQPETAVGHVYMYNRCSYDLIIDNVMDLSHVDHLHGPLINTAGKLSEQIPKVSEPDDNRVHIRWDWIADPAMLLLREHLPRPEDKADQFVEVTWQAPSHMHLCVGAVQDSPHFHRDGAVLYDFHTVTPETESTTHYFFASSRNYLLGDGDYNRAKMAGMTEAFTQEDKPVIEAQFKNMQGRGFWELKPVVLSSDAGGLRVRRVFERMLKAEQAPVEGGV